MRNVRMFVAASVFGLRDNNADYVLPCRSAPPHKRLW